jgi:hypothetical protein
MNAPGMASRNRIRAGHRIGLSSVGIALIIATASWITVAYLSNIPNMIAGSLAAYISLMAQ